MPNFIFGLISLLAVNFFMYFYVLLRIAEIFDIKNKTFLFILALFTSILIIPATILIGKNNNILTQWFYRFSGILMGVFFLSFVSLLFFRILSIILKIPLKNLEFAAFGVAFVLIVYSFYNARNISLETVKIDDFGKKMKIVQISDLHLSSESSNGLSEIVDRINIIDPEIVLITGDMVSQDTPITEKTFHLLKNLNAKSYFVTGNHEYYIHEEKVSEIIENSGVKVLRDQVDIFHGVQIAGLKYRHDKKKTIEALSSLELDQDKPVVLMNHIPLDHRDKRIKLTVSGHTHNGQIVPFNLLVRLTTKYIKGLYRLENGYIYVSPGTGTWGPPMRLGSKNEITLYDLK
ncbi:metallophosphoesterase [uncultured Ilyobacter sp.]|uniref:metallophosphoesterase n=1 Tax=uncultured Ilyobacter sp. TaxID=544433 RepID=UPI0029BFCA81|nr:metallophosphoesterase [uncultured Ilyobacter sp.]